MKKRKTNRRELKMLEWEVQIKRRLKRLRCQCSRTCLSSRRIWSESSSWILKHLSNKKRESAKLQNSENSKLGNLLGVSSNLEMISGLSNSRCSSWWLWIKSLSRENSSFPWEPMRFNRLAKTAASFNFARTPWVSTASKRNSAKSLAEKIWI